MKITKGKHIFKPTGIFSGSLSHAQVPFAMDLGNDKIRVYFSTRDEKSRSGVSFVELDKENPEKVVYIHNKLCLSYGLPGYFDDSGTMPSWFVIDNEKFWLYYTAWNKSESASYRLSIGLAESLDNGLTFIRKFEGPILDRGPLDPIWVGQPCVLKEDIWKMWYLSCQKIEYIENHPEPFYNVKYAESIDGINWERKEIVSIDFDDRTDAIGRPCVWKHNQKYYMLHSNRMAKGYRNQEEAGYRLELSISNDGLNWTKHPDFIFKKEQDGWNSIMNEYTSVLEFASGKYYVFYNGNGFGASGFGYFILDLND